MTEGAYDIIDRQGWSDATMVSLFGEYLAFVGLEREFEHYLARRAKEENEEAGLLQEEF